MQSQPQYPCLIQTLAEEFAAPRAIKDIDLGYIEDCKRLHDHLVSGVCGRIHIRVRITKPGDGTIIENKSEDDIPEAIQAAIGMYSLLYGIEEPFDGEILVSVDIKGVMSLEIDRNFYRPRTPIIMEAESILVE